MEVIAWKAFEDACCAACTVVYAGKSWPARRVTYTAGQVGLVLLEEGRCTVECAALTAGAAGGGAGSLFLAPVPFALQPLEPCRCLCAVLAGPAAAALAAALGGPVVQQAGQYPALPAQLTALCEPAAPLEPRAAAALGFGLLCRLQPGQAPAGWPALVQQAVHLIRTQYASLYGVEELAAALGVSKSHLVRCFHEALGVTPGRYLADVRIEAARQLLTRGYSLEVVAGLCGFSGANYLCKVFKKATGMSPAAFRRIARPAPAPLADEAEQNMFL